MIERSAPKNGAFGWNEVATNSLDACKSVYVELPGREAAGMPMVQMAYTVFSKNGGEPIVGMTPMTPEMREALHCLGYVAVEEIAASAGRVETPGGVMLAPPSDIPDVGRFAVIKDPAGAFASIMTLLLLP